MKKDYDMTQRGALLEYGIVKFFLKRELKCVELKK